MSNNFIARAYAHITGLGCSGWLDRCPPTVYVRALVNNEGPAGDAGVARWRLAIDLRTIAGCATRSIAFIIGRRAYERRRNRNYFYISLSFRAILMILIDNRKIVSISRKIYPRVSRKLDES